MAKQGKKAPAASPQPVPVAPAEAIAALASPVEPPQIETRKILWHFWLSGGFSSGAISWISAGHFSHVDVEVPKNSTLFPGKAGWLIGARSDITHSAATGETFAAGVQVRAPDYNVGWVRHWVMELEVPVEKFDAFWRAQFQKIGAPYDKLAILAFAFNRDWRTRGALFCSEDQALCSEIAGVICRIFEKVNKITPVMWAVIVSVIGGTWILKEQH